MKVTKNKPRNMVKLHLDDPDITRTSRRGQSNIMDPGMQSSTAKCFEEQKTYPYVAQRGRLTIETKAISIGRNLECFSTGTVGKGVS